MIQLKTKMETVSGLHAIIIITEDNLFLTHCMIYFKGLNDTAYFERSFGIDDFSVLLRELIIENFSSAVIVIDQRTNGHEIDLIKTEIKSLESTLHFQVYLGIDDFEKLNKTEKRLLN